MNEYYIDGYQVYAPTPWEAQRMVAVIKEHEHRRQG